MNFDFFPLPRIVFGAGRAAQLPELLAALGRRPLVVHFGALPEAIRPLLPAACSQFAQAGEPSLVQVEAALELARRQGVDCVVGIGGGSTIDLAKAVAALLANGGACLDYLEVVGGGRKITKPAFPWIAIPTTAGTGAEVTRNAVIAVPEKRFKASLRSELILPRVALIDPQLQLGVSPMVTAASGMDALCQCIEAYTSKGASPMTDPLALRGVELAGRALPVVLAEPANLAARSDMALAALLSGIVLTNAGLGAVHGFAAPLGALFPVPHGVACAVLLAPVMAANVHAARETGHTPLLQRYADIGRQLGAPAGATDEQAIAHAIDFTLKLVEKAQLPGLGQFGVTPAQVGEIVALARQSSSMKFNPVAPSDAALGEILLAGINPCPYPASA